MQQGGVGDYSSYYYHHHQQSQQPAVAPPPSQPQAAAPYHLPQSQPPSYASAPPFSSTTTISNVPDYSSPYPSYPHLSPATDPIPPTAPSYAQPPPYPPQTQSFNPSYPIETTYPPQHIQQQPSSYPNYSNPNPNPNPPQSVSPPSYASSYPVSTDPAYNSYDSTPKYDNFGYLDGNSGRYGGQGYNRGGQELYDRPQFRNDRSFGREDDGFGEGVYAYDGGSVEPYGARGTSGKVWSGFDDYGRATGSSAGKESSSSVKVTKAVPKAETQQDAKAGVQKFRVKLLPEGASQGTMDVLCQIGLDGVHMLDPNTSRTLRIYPLETITRWEVNDPSIYTFWSKSAVDIEPRRIRLQSNRYTTSTILDTVTAATVQLKEMGGRSKGDIDAAKPLEQTAEKKRGLVDWINIIRPVNEEKDHWVPDEAVSKCTGCGTDFGAFNRKHHCRNCGDIFCDKCTSGRIALTNDDQAQPVRVCDRCLAEVTQRLSSAKEASKPVGVQRHEDLAKKLQEEMEKNRRSTSGSSRDGSGRRMREVACPICTVHLQVQVPNSGSETIECGVCQHEFLVSAH
ncbi:protein FREE1 [Nymphaea colorata]|nr:protein FREE1 [Nymphaea colorata]